MTYKELKLVFDKELKDYYPPSEIKNLYYFTLNGILQESKLTILSHFDNQLDEFNSQRILNILDGLKEKDTNSVSTGQSQLL